MSNDMQFTVTSGGVPPGHYPAEFVGVEDYNEHLDKYGPAVVLKWRVVSGEHEGAEPTRICSKKMSPKSTLFKLAVALRGAPLKPGETFSFASVAGVRGTLLVEATDSGGGRVSTFLKS